MLIENYDCKLDFKKNIGDSNFVQKSKSRSVLGWWSFFVGHIYELPIFTPMRSLTDTLSRCKSPASNITNPPNSVQNLAPIITNHRNYLSIFPRNKQLIQGGQNRCVFPVVFHHQLGRSPLVLPQLGPVACEPGDWEEMWCYYMTTWDDMI